VVGCLIGYAALWTYFASRPAGEVFSYLSLAAGRACVVLLVLRRPLRQAVLAPEVLVPLALMYLVSLFHIAATFGCSVTTPVTDSNQFCHLNGVTGDNVLPLIFADAVRLRRLCSPRSSCGSVRRPRRGRAPWPAWPPAPEWWRTPGAAFTLGPMAVALLLARYRPAVRLLLVTAVAAIVVAAPWTAYQKLYDPPGDQLMRQTLGGVVDARPLGQTLREQYGETPIGTIAHNKLLNATTLVGYPNSDYRLAGPGWSGRARDEEFRYVLFGLGLFNLGWLVLALPSTRRRARQLVDMPLLKLMLVLVACTVVVWALALFSPPLSKPIIHHGSYATMMMVFAALGALVTTLRRRLVGLSWPSSSAISRRSGWRRSGRARAAPVLSRVERPRRVRRARMARHRGHPGAHRPGRRRADLDAKANATGRAGTGHGRWEPAGTRVTRS
jgi:hypothetical protein